MPDYEIKNRNTSLNLMSSRLGLFGGPAPAAVAGDGVAEEAALHGLDHNETLLKYNGGIPQQDRMIKDKRRSLDRALKYSYQGAFIKKVDDSAVPWGFRPVGADDTNVIRALINPNKLKADYDDKILSVPFEHGFKAGDVFEWCNTGTNWLITSQNKTELAYFRGDIRRCNYIIKWMTPDEVVHESYVATRGPVETKINFIQKNTVSLDTPNHSLNILLPKTKDTIEYFKRYARFYIMSSLYDEDPDGFPYVCYRVEAVDYISTPGIFEITAVEYYANKDKDDVEAGLADAKIFKKEKPNDSIGSTITIEGPTYIQPFIKTKYVCIGVGDHWEVVAPDGVVEWEVDKQDSNILYVTWGHHVTGHFSIKNGQYERQVIVESLL